VTARKRVPNKNQEAIECYKQAIEIKPDKPNAYILLANILVDEKRYEEALNIYKSAQNILKNNSKITTFIANTYMMLGNLEKAIEYYRKAINLSPQNNEIKLIYLELMDDFIRHKKAQKESKNE